MNIQGTEDFPWLAGYPQGIDWHAPIDKKPLHTLLEAAAKHYPDHIAVDFMGKCYRYREIYEKSMRFAAALQQRGVKKGDRVGLFMPNCPQFVISYYGVLMAGGVVVNFNPLYSEREVEHQVKDAGVRVMITLSLAMLAPKVIPLVERGVVSTLIMSDLAEALPCFKAVMFRLLKGRERIAIPSAEAYLKFAKMVCSEASLSPVAIDPERDIALLQYTGGTTGIPKGTVLTHANVYANAIQCGYWFTGLKHGNERVMGVLPLFHAFAMTTIMNLSVHCGLRMILHPRFELKKLLADIERKKPTIMPGVPTMFAAINHYEHTRRYRLSSIKLCISGGAPLPVEVKEHFESLTGCTLVEGYGLSECSPVAVSNPLLGRNKKGSIGIPLPQTIVEIVSMEDGVTPLPAGETGELCIRGPQVMQGYWNRPEETALVLRNGRLHSGDVAYMDAEGYVFIVDRLKEVIISGGYKIYPRNVEEVLYLHPAVAEAAVIGVPHELRGQVPAAFIVTGKDATVTEEELKAFAKARLAPFEVPVHMYLKDSLPKTIIGKIDKKQLKG